MQRIIPKNHVLFVQFRIHCCKEWCRCGQMLRQLRSNERKLSTQTVLGRSDKPNTLLCESRSNESSARERFQLAISQQESDYVCFKTCEVRSHTRSNQLLHQIIQRGVKKQSKIIHPTNPFRTRAFLEAKLRRNESCHTESRRRIQKSWL